MDKWTAERLAPMPVARAYARARPSTSPFTEANHRLRAIFVHVPKTGGRSIQAAAFGGDARHIPLRRYVAHDPKRAAAYLKFAVVRDPVDRFSSAFHSLKGSAVGDGPYAQWVRENIDPFADIEDFVDWIVTRRRQRQVRRWLHFRPQHQWVRVGGRIGVDRLLRFEELTVGWEEVAGRLGVSGDLPRVGMGSARPPMSESAASVVAAMYEVDREVLFGYVG